MKMLWRRIQSKKTCHEWHCFAYIPLCLTDGGQDNLLWLVSSTWWTPPPSPLPSHASCRSSSCLLTVLIAKSSKLESFLQGGVTQCESPNTLSEESLPKWPTLKFWRVANDSLMADMASKNRVQDAKATGIGRNISCMNIKKERTSDCEARPSHNFNIGFDNSEENAHRLQTTLKWSFRIWSFMTCKIHR